MNEREEFQQAATEAMKRLTTFIAELDQTRAAFERMLESLRVLRDSAK